MTTQPRTYGGWRRSRSIGLFGLGTTATFILLGAFALVLIVAASYPAALLLVGPVAVAAAAVSLVRIGGVPLGQRAVQRVHWWWGTSRAYTSYRAESMIARVGTAVLPGMLSAVELISAEDGYG